MEDVSSEVGIALAAGPWRTSEIVSLAITQESHPVIWPSELPWKHRPKRGLFQPHAQLGHMWLTSRPDLVDSDLVVPHDAVAITYMGHEPLFVVPNVYLCLVPFAIRGRFGRLNELGTFLGSEDIVEDTRVAALVLRYLRL